MSDTDEDDIDDADEEFWQGVVRTCKWMGLAQFAMIPAVFALAKLRFTRSVFALVISEVLLSLIAQVRVRRNIADWVCEQSADIWQKHVEVLNVRQGSMGILSVHDIMVYFGTLSEALDPGMDAWTAANSEQMCTATVRDKFAAAWGSFPVVGHTIGWVGLPRILLTLLCIAGVSQVYEFMCKECQVKEKIEALRRSFPFEDEDAATKSRWRVWIFASHMTDVGGLMLLHDIFQQLVQVEISLSDKIWPVADRFAAFGCLFR